MGFQKHIDSKAEPISTKKGRLQAFCTTQDVTEKKLLLENLEQSYKSLIEAERIAKLGSWEIDAANRKVVFCSDEVYRMYGIPKGQKDIDISILERYVHPEDR